LRSKLRIEAVIVSEQLARKEKAAGLVGQLTHESIKLASVSEKLLESISYTKTPQGIVLLASRPETNRLHFEATQAGPALVVVMHRINNPVNVGAILRTAEAAGATGVIATQHTADPFSPKSLRGAMGSAFRLPVWFGPTYDAVLGWCSARNLETVCADLEAATSYDEVDWRRPAALVLGPESSGLSREEVSRANAAVRIPMRGIAESLNVAVAAGVLLFEAARQRTLPKG
jgi:TrmH family RNA methyltransferase